ncbi:MAG: hypothetical protein AAFX56_09640 [Pseudomonadota bacterium]
MYLRKFAALVACLVMFSANAAQAGIEVWAVVDNQTSSAVSLGGSATRGAFTYVPLSSIAASTRIGASATWTFGFYEEGYLTYGVCSIDWDIELGYYTMYSDVYAYGNGCTARILSEIPTGPYSAIVVVELTIT